MNDNLVQVINSYNLSSTTPGIALLISKANHIIHEQYVGTKNTDLKLIDRNSKFRIASITKQFTAAAILQLIDAKKLKLDTIITDVLTELGVNASDITIKHMLTHTSGLPDYEDIDRAIDDKPFSDADVYRVMTSVPKLNFSPGSSYEYSNTAYCLLAEVIASVSGLSYKEYIETYIFPVADMHNSTVGPAHTNDRVYGFSKGGDAWQLNDQSRFSSTQGDGGIYASVADLASWQNQLYTTDKVISDMSRKLMTQPHVETNYVGESYGFGIAITTIAGETCYLHHGTSTGFENALFYLPSLDISIAILANFSGTDFNTIPFGKQLITDHINELKLGL